MKWLIILIAVLCASVLLALLAAHEPGYVLIIYQGWKIETSLALVVTILLICAVIFYYLMRSSAGLLRVPKRFGAWRSYKKGCRAESALNRGMLALFEGEWKQAEKMLAKNGKLSHAPLLNYLGAAHAAQQMAEFERRDEYLKQAAQTDVSAEIAVGLTQARLLLDQKQYEAALAGLENLRQKVPKHRFVLRLLAQTYRQLKDWQRLEDLLSVLKLYHVYSDAELQALQHDCYVQLLVLYADKHDYPTLHQLWRRMPKRMQQDAEVVQHYAELLISMDHQDEAELLLRSTLQRQWQGSLLMLYGQLQGSKGELQLQSAERWLQQHGDDAQLLLTLGRICMHNQLWGKAKAYLQQAADREQREAFLLLTEVLEQQGEEGLAQQYYRKGLQLLT